MNMLISMPMQSDTDNSYPPQVELTAINDGGHAIVEMVLAHPNRTVTFKLYDLIKALKMLAESL